MLKWLAIILCAGAVAAAGTFWFVCPCEVVPGGPLAGQQVSQPVADWDFVNDVRLCQMQVDVGIPWSLNLNCMASEGNAYVSCSNCAGKTWSQAALQDPRGFLRVEEQLYPVNLRRLTDAAELDVAWAARVKKLNLEPDLPRPDHWWSFHLTSR